MHIIKLTAYQAVGVAAVVLLVGRWLTLRWPVLQKYCIPAPVVGGFIFSLLNLVSYATHIGYITFDATFQTFFMTIFYCTVGATASFKQLGRGGKQVLVFLVIVCLLCVGQNLVGASLAKLFGLNAKLGLAMGSIPMVGGTGTAGSFGPVLEANGVTGATTVAIASATFGLVAGSAMGGPLALRRINKLNLKPEKMTFEEEALNEEVTRYERDVDSNDSNERSVLTYAAAREEAKRPSINQERFMLAAIWIAVAVGAGTLIYNFFLKLGITFPSYIGAMLLASLMRNIGDQFKSLSFPNEEIDTLGHISLNLFLAMALMSMQLWLLADLALPMVVILIAEGLLTAFIAYYVVFHFMGGDYEAACFTTATTGFGMGATPNAMANIAAVNEKFGPSPNAMFVVPLVGALFIDFCNSLIITSFINIL